jgi:hypothetical protein
MTFQMIAKLCVAALLVLGFSAHTAAAVDFRPLRHVGAGAHTHRFLLKDPLTGAPMAGARYRLFLENHHIPGTPSDDGIVWGITDSRGYTATVRLRRHYARSEWVLIPVQGKGDSGTFFSVVTTQGDIRPGAPYIVSLDGSYLFCGKTSSAGVTDYFMAKPGTSAHLYAEMSDLSASDYAWCKSETAMIARLPADAEPADVFRTLYSSYSASNGALSKDLLEVVGQQLLELAIAGRNTEQAELALSLGIVDKNNAGYELVDANWMVERGMDLIDQALALKPDNPSILDSKGWALYRNNQPALALSYLDRSIAAFEAAGKDNLVERSIGLVHKGEVLWQMGRKAEARLVFAAARELAAEDSTLEETLERLEVDLDGDTDAVEPAASKAGAKSACKFCL